MKYIKMLGLLAVAAAALMAFAGVASATTLTSPAETTYTSTIHAVAGTTTLHNLTIGNKVTCTSSTVEGKVESHGTNVTAKGNISKLTFSGCGTDDVTVLKAGSLEIHTDSEKADGNGTLTSSGAEITINSTSVGISCTYTTSGTHIGTLTGSRNLGGSTAVLTINSAVIPRTGDSVFCGSGGGIWTGSYSVDVPMYLDVD